MASKKPAGMLCSNAWLGIPKFHVAMVQGRREFFESEELAFLDVTGSNKAGSSTLANVMTLSRVFCRSGKASRSSLATWRSIFSEVAGFCQCVWDILGLHAIHSLGDKRHMVSHFWIQ